MSCHAFTLFIIGAMLYSLACGIDTRRRLNVEIIKALRFPERVVFIIDGG